MPQSLPNAKRRTCPSIGVVVQALLLMVLLPISWARGQDFDRYRPKEPFNREGRATLPKEPKAAAGDAAVLTPQLCGVVFVDHPDQVRATETVEATGVEFATGSHLPLLRRDGARIVGPYLGKPVSLLSLNQLTRDVVLFYREHKLPVVDVSVPPQKITNGVVQIVVVEGRVGKITVDGARYFDNADIAAQLCVDPCDQIHEECILEDLRWLNSNPFREVNLELKPGQGFGRTDLLFTVCDRRPYSVYTGYEDSGTRPLGLERLLLGGYWGNALWRDDRFGYQLTGNPDFDSLVAHSAFYTLNRSNRDQLTFMGSYADVSSQVVDPISSTGFGWQTSVRYDRDWIPGACSPRGANEIHWVGGFDVKRTNTNLDFGGTTVADTAAELVQLVGGLYGIHRRSFGVATWGTDLVVSVTGMLDQDSVAAFQEIRPGANPDYIYTRAYLNHDHYITSNWILTGRFSGQLAGSNLLPSEQLGFGGYTSVRGYDMRLINGDSGVLASLELKPQPIRWDVVHGRRSEWQPLAFFDYGDAFNHSLLPGEPSSVTLYSVGAGVRAIVAENLTLRCDLGIPLRDVVLGPGDETRLHIGTVLRY